MSAPAYPPPNHPLPLKDVALPYVVPEDVSCLSINGFTKVNPSDAFLAAVQDLLAASEAFFALPLEEKAHYKGNMGSELGWSRIEGEKELITLRDLPTTPDLLKGPASTYWSLCGKMLNGLLGKIAESLNLPPEALTRFSAPCAALKEDKTATMLRLFRYDSDQAFKVVAEPHADLGLLSLVVGDTPGLEVWERCSQAFYPIEQEFLDPAASLLCGTQLARLTNFRYAPGRLQLSLRSMADVHEGGHRVMAYPNSILDPPTRRSPKHRYSIVFILRAHYPVSIDTDKLTTAITGPFQQPMRGIKAIDLFRQISNSSYNINIDQQEREEQKKRLAVLQQQQGSG
jgi:hypothetical protein